MHAGQFLGAMTLLGYDWHAHVAAQAPYEGWPALVLFTALIVGGGIKVLFFEKRR
jgi:TRAP-type C4-dicarboxylate transport system permease small subunit